jgi:hypothetical protein
MYAVKVLGCGHQLFAELSACFRRYFNLEWVEGKGELYALSEQAYQLTSPCRKPEVCKAATCFRSPDVLPVIGKGIEMSATSCDKLSCALQTCNGRFAVWGLQYFKIKLQSKLAIRILLLLLLLLLLPIIIIIMTSGTRYHRWLRRFATSRKVNDFFFNLPNPSSRITALEFT